MRRLVETRFEGAPGQGAFRQLYEDKDGAGVRTITAPNAAAFKTWVAGLVGAAGGSLTTAYNAAATAITNAAASAAASLAGAQAVKSLTNSSLALIASKTGPVEEPTPRGGWYWRFALPDGRTAIGQRADRRTGKLQLYVADREDVQEARVGPRLFRNRFDKGEGLVVDAAGRVVGATDPVGAIVPAAPAGALKARDAKAYIRDGDLWIDGPATTPLSAGGSRPFLWIVGETAATVTVIRARPLFTDWLTSRWTIVKATGEQFLDDPRVMLGMFGYGQSNITGTTQSPFVVAPYSAPIPGVVMPGRTDGTTTNAGFVGQLFSTPDPRFGINRTGITNLEPILLANHDHLVPAQSVQLTTAPSGGTQVEAAAKRFAERRRAAGVGGDVFICVPGVGAIVLDGLKKNSTWGADGTIPSAAYPASRNIYDDYEEAHDIFVARAAERGQRAYVLAILWDHGSGDFQRDDYPTNLPPALGDMQATAIEKTGQVEPPFVVGPQTTYYGQTPPKRRGAEGTLYAHELGAMVAWTNDSAFTDQFGPDATHRAPTGHANTGWGAGEVLTRLHTGVGYTAPSLGDPVRSGAVFTQAIHGGPLTPVDTIAGWPWTAKDLAAWGGLRACRVQRSNDGAWIPLLSVECVAGGPTGWRLVTTCVADPGGKCWVGHNDCGFPEPISATADAALRPRAGFVGASLGVSDLGRNVRPALLTSWKESN